MSTGKLERSETSRWGLLALLLLAPAIPELLTGSTPFWKFVNPLNLVLLVIAYGFPAVLFREFAISKGLSYRRLMYLGMLQGVLVEGLMVNTFYSNDPTKMGVFASYGRWLGVNWPWAFYLTFFHSIFSVFVPIMLVDSLFGRDPLIRPRTTWFLLPIVVATTVLFNLSEDVFRPPAPYHILSLLFMTLILSSFMLTEDSDMLSARLRFPRRRLYLFPPIFVIFAFFALAQWVPPVVSILVGIALYASLYNSLAGASLESAWGISKDLLVGMIATGLLAALLDRQHHIIVPAIFFSILLLILSRRRSAVRMGKAE